MFIIQPGLRAGHRLCRLTALRQASLSRQVTSQSTIHPLKLRGEQKKPKLSKAFESHFNLVEDCSCPDVNITPPDPSSTFPYNWNDLCSVFCASSESFADLLLEYL